MIVYKQQNLLTADAVALVNTVNTVGVMGKGIALQFKEKFPLNFKLYQEACKNGEVQPGKMFVTATGLLTNPQYIINFPTKTDWRKPSRLEYISAGLDDLVRLLAEKGISSIVLPPLGCGNGGLDWKDVKPLMERKLATISAQIEITIIEPGHHAYARTVGSEAPPLTKPRALVLALADAYRILGFDISHLELQKLAFFLQQMGQDDLKLRFSKGFYGPYATNLKHLIAYLEGYYIKGQIRFQDTKPTDALFLSDDKMAQVREWLAQNLTSEEQERRKKVEAFITGFESPFGLELLATVFWAKNELHTSEAAAIVNYIHNWTERKKALMSPAQIGLALKRVNDFFGE